MTDDQLATAVVMLAYLEQVGLGPAADAEPVAQALDDVAIACSPHRDLAVNPAKMLAIALADATRWSGAARCSPPAPPDGWRSRSVARAGGPPWPATPSTCCR